MKLTITIEKNVDELEEASYIVKLVKSRLADQENIKVDAHVTEQVGVERYIPDND